jgi:hypothetical protein
MNTDTPLPLDEPRMPNPPDGAIINYVLKADAKGPVTLEILDAAGKVIRHYASTDRPESVPDASAAAVPLYWYRSGRALPASAGMHRVTWDMRYDALPGGGGGRGGLPIAAVPYNTGTPSTAPWVAPGTYTVKLTADGRSATQPITVKMDPRVRTSAVGLQQQATLSRQLYDGAVSAQATVEQLRALREQADAAAATTTDVAAKTALEGFVKKVVALGGAAPAAGGPGGGRGGAGAGGGPSTGSGQGGRGGAGVPAADSFANIGASLSPLITVLQAADAAPTSAVVAAASERQVALAKLQAQFAALKTGDLAAVNAMLAKAGQAAIVVK